MKKLTTKIVVSTALGLLMAQASAMAAPSSGERVPIDPVITGPAPERVLRLAQASDAELTDEEKAERRERRQRGEEPAEEAAPEQAPVAEEPAPAAPAAEEAAPAAPAEEPAPAAPAAEEPAPAAPAVEEPAAEEPAAEEPAAEQPAAEQPVEEPAAPVIGEPAAEEPAAEEPVQEAPAPAAEDAAPAAPAAQEPAAEQPAPADEAAPAETPSAPDTGTDGAAGETPPPALGEQPADEAATPEQSPAEQAAPLAEDPETLRAQDPEGVLPENAAPVLDSQKRPRGERTPRDDGQAEAPRRQRPEGPPPTDDASAQGEVVDVDSIGSVTAEEGTRIERDRPRRRERPDGVDVLREIGNRVILELNNQIIVESNDRQRLSRGARDVYYEDLPRGRTRETIVRDNGVQIVTIRDRYGEVIRRSRITPDGREYVLVYVDEERRGQREGRWRDPGDDLEPLVLTIPVSEYILDGGRARDSDAYYDFLYQPPVERVERLYSIDEVRRSARLRDSVRRVDLDTITFEFGSASIAEAEVQRLAAVAEAMERMLEANPAETFLIEGHTDAVGTDMANLALSDQRAESVAAALTNVFGIPPENLVTQGYGEQYLKVATQEPERANRRVAMRRITPLVAPVAANR